MKTTDVGCGVASKFKTCTLCGAVNSNANWCCTNCSWRGTFESRATYMPAVRTYSDFRCALDTEGDLQESLDGRNIFWPHLQFIVLAIARLLSGRR